jgi:hypothetical protein
MDRVWERLVLGQVLVVHHGEKCTQVTYLEVMEAVLALQPHIKVKNVKIA